MKFVVPNSDAVRLIRYSSFLWLGYLILLFTINQTLFPPPPDHPTIYYYLGFMGFLSLLCLGLSSWTKIQPLLGRAFIPIIIGIITVLPILATITVARLFGPAPMFDPQSSVLMLLPFFMVAFLMVAWQYGWLHTLLIILGINMLNFAGSLSFPPPHEGPFRGPIIVSLIQTIMFLVVGFSVSYLISRIKNQQQSLEAANVTLTHYASTLEQLATSRERNRLSRELHDTLAHTLSGLAVQLETVKAYFKIDQDTSQLALEKALTSVHSGLTETRRALKALRASRLDELGLSKAIVAMAEESAAQAHLTLSLSIPLKMPTMSPDIEQCIYRTAQEAITNAVNHAGAKNLSVNIDAVRGKIILGVIDDGIGFEVSDAGGGDHFGLSVMRERAQVNGGKLDIISRPGEGTVVRLTI